MVSGDKAREEEAPVFLLRPGQHGGTSSDSVVPRRIKMVYLFMCKPASHSAK